MTFFRSILDDAWNLHDSNQKIKLYTHTCVLLFRRHTLDVFVRVFIPKKGRRTIKLSVSRMSDHYWRAEWRWLQMGTIAAQTESREYHLWNTYDITLFVYYVNLPYIYIRGKYLYVCVLFISAKSHCYCMTYEADTDERRKQTHISRRALSDFSIHFFCVSSPLCVCADT